MNEFDWIEYIKKKAGKVPTGWTGIGDDAAALNLSASKKWVISTDVIVEGIDFDATVSAAQAGRKALAVNLSDMAAMGAKPVAFLMTLGVSKKWNGSRLRGFIQGVFKLAGEYNVICVGGDMSGSDQFFCSITIFGEAKKPILRAGAKAGDLILVTGSLGGSIHRKHYAFTPRVAEARWLEQHYRPSAMLDLSDGLTQDLAHLLRASVCSARIDLENIPMAKAAKNLQAALSDGEDFELLMTMPPAGYARLQSVWKRKFPKVKLTIIGKIMPGRSQIKYFKNGHIQNDFKPRPGFRHL